MSKVAGTRNKPKQYLIRRLNEYYGEDFEPVVKMAEQAVFLHAVAKNKQETYFDDDDPATIEATKDALAAWNCVAKYVTPQLKAIEHAIPDGVDVNLDKVDKLDIAKRVAFLLNQAIEEPA